MKRITLLVSSFILCIAFTHAQLVSNNAMIALGDNALVYADMDLVSNSQTTIDNQGELHVTGNIINNNSSKLFTPNRNGLVNLSGGNQSISGSPVLFNQLQLSESGVKTCKVNVEVDNVLSLTDRILDLEANTIHILNPLPGALLRTTGFINTDKEGVVKMEAIQPSAYYTFETGSLKNNLYRPVYIQLASGSTSANTYAVSYLPNNPDGEGLLTKAKADNIDEVNTKFYYYINREKGKDSATVSLYFDSLTDGSYNQTITWDKNNLQWYKDPLFDYGRQDGDMGDGLNYILQFWGNQFNNQYYNVATTLPRDRNIIEPLEANNNVSIPNSFTPANKDGLNDFWEIKGIEKFPDNQVVIYNRWGEVVFETKGYSNSNHFNAADLMQDVYMYVVKVKDNNKGYQKTYTGDLTILK